VLTGAAGGAGSVLEGTVFTAGTATGVAGGVGLLSGGAAHAVTSNRTAQGGSCESSAWSFPRRSFMIGQSITSRFLMDLLWFLLEAGVALSLLLGIVWWTWPRAPKDKGASTEKK